MNTKNEENRSIAKRVTRHPLYQKLAERERTTSKRYVEKRDFSNAQSEEIVRLRAQVERLQSKVAELSAVKD